jgi:hypothetical protein
MPLVDPNVAMPLVANLVKISERWTSDCRSLAILETGVPSGFNTQYENFAC